LFIPYAWGKSVFTHLLDAFATQANFIPFLILPNIIIFLFYLGFIFIPVDKLQSAAKVFFIISIVYFVLSCLVWIALFVSDSPNFVFMLLVVLPCLMLASFTLLSQGDKLFKLNVLMLAGMLPSVTFFAILGSPSDGFFSNPGIGYYILNFSFLGILIIRIVQLIKYRKRTE
jgi:hypothetical protein